jgi:rod shape-determining protein MreD
MRRILIDVLVCLAVIVAHTTLSKFIAIGGIVPDIPLILVVYLALRRGQIVGTVVGFGMGLALDLLGGTESMLGLSALAKTSAGFIAGYFYNENKMSQILGGYQFVVIVTLASAVHNLLYFLVFLQGSGINWTMTLLRYGLPTTLYTAAVSVIPMFVSARKNLAQA